MFIVDILNLFNVKGIFSLDESFVVIRLCGIKNVDFFYLLVMIDGLFMLCYNIIVVFGGKMSFVMEFIVCFIL